MTHLQRAFLSLCLSIFFIVLPVQAARDTDSYDGNIFPIYTGNGSMVPPSSTLSESLNKKRTSVIAFYLDDSSDSKAFAPILSGLKLVWGNAIDIIPLTTDELQGKEYNEPRDEGFYWHGNIPQIVVIDSDGNVLLDEEGLVNIETVNESISRSTGLDIPFNISIKSFNEYNSEPSKEGYTDPRK